MANQGADIKTLFEQCVDLPIDEQIAFIHTANYSQTVKDKVLSLLKHQDNEIDISEHMMHAVKHTLHIDDLKQGDIFNEFELVKPIGHGGQGDVWLAKRVD